jgi:hypothetical protein
LQVLGKLEWVGRGDRVLVPDLARDLDSGLRVRVDLALLLADRLRRLKRRALRVLRDRREAAGVSSIQRPKKAR